MNRKAVKKAVSIGDEIGSFASHIDSLWESLPMTMLLNQLLGSGNEKKLREFEDEKCSVQKLGDSRRVRIPLEHYNKWKKLRLSRDQTLLASKLVPRSLFVSVVSQYDAFLGKILRLVFLLKPELLNASKREIPFIELVQFPSIEAAREHVIGKEIDSILRMSHVEQFRWMENRFDVKLTKLEAWPVFVELTQRRNLFVHVDGLVSKQYISECNLANCLLADGLKEGDFLSVSAEYFDQACSSVFEVGVKLANVLWRKLAPGQIAEADSCLNELAFDLIERKKLQLAIALLSFGVNLPRHSDESRRRMMVVNLAQAFKWHGEKEESLRVLNAEDWSAVADEFKLADAVLRCDWPRATKVMLRIGPNGSVQALSYRDWPLFQEFRLRPEFLKAYLKVFKEPFPATVESETKETTSPQSMEPEELPNQVEVIVNPTDKRRPRTKVNSKAATDLTD